MIAVIFLAAILLSPGAPHPEAQGKLPPTAQNESTPDLKQAAELTVLMVELYRQGKYQEALPLARRVVEIREAILGPKDEPLRNGWRNLAEVNLALGKHSDARIWMERLIQASEEFTPDDPGRIRLLQKLAVIQFEIGKSEKVETAYLESTKLAERLFGAVSLELAHALILLGDFYRYTSEFKKAELVYERILSIREKLNSSEGASALHEVFVRYACVLRKRGKEQEALSVESKGSETARRVSQDQVLNGVAISLPAPVYTFEARTARASGVVIVKVVIDETGRVVFACATKGHRELVQSSENAAYQAKFSPTKVSGQPTRVTGVITYNYKRWGP